MSDIDKTLDPPLDPGAVLRFLKANPDFWVRHGADFAPQQAQNPTVVDLTQALIKRASHIIRHLNAQHDRLSHIHNTNSTSMERTHQAACLLMAAGNAADITTIIGTHFPLVLGVRAARLMVIEESPLAVLDHTIALAPKTLAQLVKSDEVALGKPNAPQSQVWHSVLVPPPPSVAFVRLPPLMEGYPSAGVLGLAGMNSNSFHALDASDLLEFIATLIAIALFVRGGD